MRDRGCGSEESTFQGLAEMRAFASAFKPAAKMHLWVQADGVLFELRLRVTVVPSITLQGKEVAPALPKGLSFVCCDDDDMPRIFVSSQGLEPWYSALEF